MIPPWDCTSISATAAGVPRLPSIWNVMFGFVPPGGCVVSRLSDVHAASMPWSESSARSPSPSRAHTNAAHERLQDPLGVLLASRCSSDLVIAPMTAGSPSASS